MTHDETENTGSLAARHIALDILVSVIDRKNALDAALEHETDFASLPARDRGFARMLATTTIRRMGQIDHVIASCESRMGASRPPVLQHILRLGVTQIAFMNVPDHAAVDTSVQMAEEKGCSRQKGFVNGVLRNVARTGRGIIEKQDAGRLNTPEWLMRLWVQDYDLRGAAQIMEANLAEAPLDLSLKDPETRNYWSAHFQAINFPTGSLRITSGGHVTSMDGFDDGAWWVQDAAAAIPAQLFGDVSGKTVVDMCAAPGGKTAQLAAQGANVIALDRSSKRLERLKENMARLGLSDRAEVIVADAGAWTPKDKFDYILLDAPCSATGTIRRHPDILHSKRERDIAQLAALQERLLDHAFSLLNSGGVLIYCTCSLQKREGENQVSRFLERQKDAHKIAVQPDEVGGVTEILDAHGDVRILPYHRAASGGMDGFFISRIGKA